MRNSQSTTVSTPTHVLPSLRALMAHLIDYAGLFPPAKLPLEQAFPNYARYRTGPHAWMLAHFIIPAGRLSDLDAHADLIAEGPAPFTFSALGGGGDDEGSFRENLTAQAQAVRAFLDRYPGRVAVPQLELRLPAHAEAYGQLLTDAQSVLNDAGLSPEAVFFEAGLAEDWRTRTRRAVSALSKAGFGYKLRTGGITADLHPTPEQVACVITTCREGGVPFKATAGLHKPTRNFAPHVQTKQHGFLNVFAGAILSFARSLPMGALQSILEEEDSSCYVFTEDGIGWRNFSADQHEIEEARARVAISFGSCSFDEPREELEALGLL